MFQLPESYHRSDGGSVKCSGVPIWYSRATILHVLAVSPDSNDQLICKLRRSLRRSLVICIRCVGGSKRKTRSNATLEDPIWTPLVKGVTGLTFNTHFSFTSVWKAQAHKCRHLRSGSTFPDTPVWKELNYNLCATSTIINTLLNEVSIKRQRGGMFDSAPQCVLRVSGFFFPCPTERIRLLR